MSEPASCDVCGVDVPAVTLKHIRIVLTTYRAGRHRDVGGFDACNACARELAEAKGYGVSLRRFGA